MNSLAAPTPLVPCRPALYLRVARLADVRIHVPAVAARCAAPPPQGVIVSAYRAGMNCMGVIMYCQVGGGWWCARVCVYVNVCGGGGGGGGSFIQSHNELLPTQNPSWHGVKVRYRVAAGRGSWGLGEKETWVRWAALARGSGAGEGRRGEPMGPVGVMCPTPRRMGQDGGGGPASHVFRLPTSDWMKPEAWDARCRATPPWYLLDDGTFSSGPGT